jgi:hypothetical protein
MRTREFGFTAMARFVAVERYCQSHQPSLIHPLPGSGSNRTGGHASKPDRNSGAQAPARPAQG